MIPGSNLFNQAIKVIKPIEIDYLQFSGRTLNQARQYVPSYDPAKKLWASVQAVNNANYKAMDLDWKKNYVKIFAAENAVSLDRDASSDRFVIASKTYQMIDDTSWFLQDGWVSCVAVEIKP